MARTGGFTRTPNDLLEDGTISASARLLYIILLKYAWTVNKAYPGQKRLAKMVGVDDRTIRTYLKELEGKGLISVRRQGLTKTNLYTLHKWISPTLKRKNNLHKSDSSHPPLSGSQFPTNNTQYEKTKSEKAYSPQNFSMGSVDIQALADAVEVKTSAIEKVAEKYLLDCEDKGRQPSLAGLKKWTLTERWELEDYNAKKQSEIERMEIMRSFM